MIYSHPDVVLFDKRKQRVGVLTEVRVGPLKQRKVKVAWSDGGAEHVEVSRFTEPPFNHYKAIRLRDFPQQIPFGGTTLPARIRKDSYTLGDSCVKFIRLLDIIAVVPLDKYLIADNLPAFLPILLKFPDCSDQIIKIISEHFARGNKDQFIIEIKPDRTNHSFYRVRITTSILIKKTQH